MSMPAEASSMWRLKQLADRAALSPVKELEWTGTATITAGGKTTVVDLETVVRPLTHWARSTSWPKADRPKAARTIQTEQGKGWTVNRVTWTPMPEAQAVHENQQFALYSLMLLTPLKDPAAKVSEQPAGAGGAHAIKASLANGMGGDLSFDAAGETLRRNADRARSGRRGRHQGNGDFLRRDREQWRQMAKEISIQQNGQPYFDLETGDVRSNARPQAAPAEAHAG